MTDRTKKAWRLAALTGLLAFPFACSTSQDDAAPLPTAPPAQMPSTFGLGFDPGVSLIVLGSRVSATAGAVVPGSDRRIAFVAFTSSAMPTGLVKDSVVAVDTLGSLDLFIAAIESTDIEVPGFGAMPSAFSQALMPIFQHDRCTNCHGAGAESTPPGTLDIFGTSAGGSHPGGSTPLDVNTPQRGACSECHTPDVTGTIPEWRAPLFSDAPHGSFDFRGKNAQELNTQASGFDPTGLSFGGGVEHLKTNEFIRWALETGTVQGGALAGSGPATFGAGGGLSTWRDIGPVGITHSEFGALVDAWAAGGFAATPASAVKDLIQVSVFDDSGTLTAANGTSFSPSMTFVPFAGFNSLVPSEQRVGDLYIAFSTTSTDIVPGFVNTGFTPTTNIVRVQVPVWIDRNPNGNDVITGQAVDLRVSSSPAVLVSATAADEGANYSSASASISADGNLIAFESSATNLGLVGGLAFDDNNSHFNDIFVRNVATATSDLLTVASAPPGATQYLSYNPAISPDGAVVAFSSSAYDLQLGAGVSDTNRGSDLFFAMLDADGLLTGNLDRADKATGMTQGPDGGSSRASVFHNSSTGDIRIAFESNKPLYSGPDGLSPLVMNTWLYRRVGASPHNTYLVNQGPTGAGGVQTSGDHFSMNPRITPNGRRIIFETSSRDLDSVYTDIDDNLGRDIMEARVQEFFDQGALGSPNFKLRRLSISAIGTTAARPSRLSAVGGFRLGNGDYDSYSFVSFLTPATNVDGSTNTDEVFIFLND